MHRLGTGYTVLLLLALALLVQWHACRRAVVPALDAVRFVALAQSIEREGLRSFVRDNADQPLYPALIAGVHRGLNRIVPGHPQSWLIAAQTTAAAAIVLCVVPLYVLLKSWLGRRQAFLGCVLFLLLPEVARLGADAIADSWMLLTLLIALACIVHALALSRGRWLQGGGPVAGDGSARWLAAAGTACAVSLLVGTGSLAVAPALACTLPIARPLAPSLAARLRWSAPFFLALGLTYGGYLLSVQATDSATARARLLGSHRAEAASVLNTAHDLDVKGIKWVAAEGAPLHFTRTDAGMSTRRQGWIVAARNYLGQLGQVSHYWIGLAAAWGAWKMRRARHCLPGRFLFVYALVFTVVAISYSQSAGYLSARHLLPLVPVLVGWSAQGLWSIASTWSRKLKSSFRPGSQAGSAPELWPSSAAVCGALAIACVLPAGIEALQPAHGYRQGHRVAAQWLAEQTDTRATVFDTMGLTALYSGRTTFRAEAGHAALADPQLAYLVVATAELNSASERAITLRSILETSAELAATFTASTGSVHETVAVYRWRPERFAARHTKQSTRHRTRKI